MSQIHTIHFYVPPFGSPAPRYNFCHALINQNVYVGEDPVGHACWNHATTEVILQGYRIPVCEQCNAWLLEHWQKSRSFDEPVKNQQQET